MRSTTLRRRERLYEDARALVARRYSEQLTIAQAAAELASSPRELQRAYAHFGGCSFAEDLRARRMQAAAELLATQRALAITQVALLAGYRHRGAFAGAFATCFGLAPSEFRRRAQRARG